MPTAKARARTKQLAAERAAAEQDPALTEDDLQLLPQIAPGSEAPKREPSPKRSHHKPTDKRNRRSRYELVRDEVGPDIERLSGLISLGLTPFSPTAAEFNEQRSSKTVEDMVRLCVRHPRLIPLLKQSGDLMAYAGIGEWAGGIVIAVMVDRGMIDPEFVAARFLGVTDAYRIVKKANDENTDGHDQGTFAIPTELVGAAGSDR